MIEVKMDSQPKKSLKGKFNFEVADSDDEGEGLPKFVDVDTEALAPLRLLGNS